MEIIGDQAFAKCTLLTGEIRFRPTLTSIGVQAFMGSPLTGILIIPSTVITLGSNAFDSPYFSEIIYYHNKYPYMGPDYQPSDWPLGIPFGSLENQKLPFARPLIAEGCITKSKPNSACSFGLISIDTHITEIADDAFSTTGEDYCYDLTGHLNIPDNILKIGKNSFLKTNFTNITIGNNVAYIGSSAFSSNAFHNVHLYIPISVKKIGYSAFLNSRIIGVTYYEGLERGLIFVNIYIYYKIIIIIIILYTYLY